MTSRHLAGPMLVLATLVVSALPFTQMRAPEEDPVGLTVGMLSIVTMAWTFLLAVRIPALEPLFGGLDRVYAAHRWLGVIAVVLMFWHVRAGNEVDGTAGAAPAAAELGESLGGFAEASLYVLVIASVLRWLPWRWWRLTHKLMGVPFIFASVHVWTAEKPFANLSGWGIWFLAIMVIGTASYLWRVVVRDHALRGGPHRITAVVAPERTVELRLQPLRRPLRRRPGQFAFLRLRDGVLAEPHPFSIASAPGDPELRFFVRELGDWTAALGTRDLQDRIVDVEGPYGRLALRPRNTARRTVWFAAGVGITPFLSDLEATEGAVPELVYAVRDARTAHAIEPVLAAAQAGRIRLHLVESASGRRLDAALLDELFGEGGLRGAHVAACGPEALLVLLRKEARRRGVRRFERESFELRPAIGPDLTPQIARALQRFAASRRQGGAAGTDAR